MTWYYGFRSNDGAALVQIAGGGRVRVEKDGRKWWADPKKLAPWTVVRCDDAYGHAFSTLSEAEQVARNLNGADPIDVAAEKGNDRD